MALIEPQQDRAILKYTDSEGQTFKCIVLNTHPFVKDYCDKDIEKFVSILGKHTIHEMGDFCYVNVNEPVTIKFKLVRDERTFIENVSSVMTRLDQILEENTILRARVDILEKTVQRLETDKQKLENKLDIVDKHTANLHSRSIKMNDSIQILFKSRNGGNPQLPEPSQMMNMMQDALKMISTGAAGAAPNPHPSTTMESDSHKNRFKSFSKYKPKNGTSE